MIQSIQLENFKALGHAEVPLSGITVLSGTNSCGKSSIIQGILTLKQTIEDPHPNIVLKLNGPLVKLGQLKDVLINHDESKDLTFILRLPANRARRYAGYSSPRGPLREGSIELVVGFRNEGTDIVVSKYHVTYEDQSGLPVLWAHFDRVEGLYDVSFSSLTVASEGYFPLMRELAEKKNAQKPVSFKGAQVEFFGFIPVTIGGTDYLEALRRELKSRRLSAVSLADFSRKDEPKFSIAATLSYAVRDAVRETLRKVSYIGPLREEPRRHYIFDQGTANQIGNKGEYAAQILFSEQLRKISHYPTIAATTVEKSTLIKAVRHWICDQFKMAKDIKVNTVDSAIYQVRLGREESAPPDVTISDVGFGISQILPIVVEGLRADEEAVLIFEQPEIHLHPRVQSMLADFLICLSRSGKHVIVETHSDHFITRMRRRIAEDLSDSLEQNIRMFFVKPSVGCSIVEPLEVDVFGNILNWPPDFFDQAEMELRSLAKAQLAKKKHKEASKRESHV